MSVTGIIRIALKSLTRNKTRTFLTMLGIIIGVAAVIAMLSIGQGAQKIVEDQVNSMGTNVIMVSSNFSQSAVRQAAGGGNLLTVEDVTAMREQLDGVLYASPVYNSWGQLKYEGNNWRGSVMGVDADYFFIRNMQTENGDLFYSSDVENGAKVCVIGKTVADNLFGDIDPVGKIMRIRNIPFTIAGVLTAKGQSVMGNDQDDIVLAPYTTVYQRLLGHRWRNMSIMVSAVSRDAILRVQQDIMDLLQARHRGTTSEEFVVSSQTDLAETANSVSHTMTILLASIAGISLLVGGIGIMNIMLVSVTERVKEIGIRMAVGAGKRDVLLQFIIEAMAISIMGGILGILLGFGAARVVGKVMDWNIAVTMWSIVLSVGFSMVIGIFFGWYPARKAANLNLIDALRYE
ncbi:MAG: ABC transporter permease [Candidatus Cloacimonadales bacterium]|jgi:putative ABC transport system permease protein|nr:ABC transporter permease [Candidatus Cloacimonadota bacterium]MDY0380662.1 ABC transporter permease [Candidatus Cloacimonadaceae bacterium]MCB5257356.1 ABC transporter permease [Candidatus Cloacimonadota bacterium]MCB5276135.1 ABC transporter permease [Candidatus Cloacimonadota bacterium]MCK9433243.1 ABC transporter permease [Candidatus Cloacimonadota bacterium]